MVAALPQCPSETRCPYEPVSCTIALRRPPLCESPPTWPLIDMHHPPQRDTTGELSGPPYGHTAHLLPRLDTATERLGTPRDGLLPPSRGSLPTRDIDAASAGATSVGNLPTDGADRLPNGVSGVSLLRDESPALHVPTPVCSGNGQQSSHDALLQDASRIIESLSGAMQSVLSGPRAKRTPFRIPIPKYKGYDDAVSATDFLEDLLHYQQAMGISDQEILGHILLVALTDQAAR